MEDIKDYNKEDLSIVAGKLIASQDEYMLNTEEEKIIARRILRKNLLMQGYEAEYNNLIDSV